MVILEYVGEREEFIYSLPTGRWYKSGRRYPEIVVTDDDATYLLGFMENGRQVFKVKQDENKPKPRGKSGRVGGDQPQEDVRSSDGLGEGQVSDLVPDAGNGEGGSESGGLYRRSRRSSG